MRTQPETRARSSQEAGKRALNLRGSKANQACNSPWALASAPTATRGDAPGRARTSDIVRSSLRRAVESGWPISLSR